MLNWFRNNDTSWKKSGVAVAVSIALFICLSKSTQFARAGLPSDVDIPAVWTTYRTIESLDADFMNLKRAGVGLVSIDARNAEDAREKLRAARQAGMKFHISMGDITEHADIVRRQGFEPESAIMIGGVYYGKAIDRHVFAFTPDRHTIIIEPPVYNRGFAYTQGSGATGRPKDTEKIAHYFPDIGNPVRAEIVVPLRFFDGEQHVKIVEAKISEAPAGAEPENDSVTGDMPESSETRERKLYELTFDLTGLDDALLNMVGVAVYWEYGGSDKYWMFGRGNVSARAASTVKALRKYVSTVVTPWKQANGGEFPLDVVRALRFGDECFFITSHLNGPAVSYPLWDYSESSIAAFHKKAGEVEYPRTWGFPEIYGSNAYAIWLYNLHEGCAALCGIVREEIAREAPGLMLFRNQTRAGAYSLTNDHDGSGQELLARNLDIIHLDPYPVNSSGYNPSIPRDMSYLSGLARRYGRILLPWMQAHTYGGPGGLQDVSPEDVDRMAEEQWAQGIDAVMWLGWGPTWTFPDVRPESWRRAIVFHKRLSVTLAPKPKAKLAVLRPYSSRALLNLWEEKMRNPSDWLLQQFLEVWAVRHGMPFDVFEVPPVLSDAEKALLTKQIKQYEYAVSTEPFANAWMIGGYTGGMAVGRDMDEHYRDYFERLLREKGWLR